MLALAVAAGVLCALLMPGQTHYGILQGAEFVSIASRGYVSWRGIMSPAHIRAARESDLAVMRDIERPAGSWFREIGMPEIADDEPLPCEELARYRQDNRAWVAADDADVPAAYLIADIVDGSVHIEQVSVHPRAARRKIGRMLLEHAATYAAAWGIGALTLTTFAEVPWNAPYYARCGPASKVVSSVGETRTVPCASPDMFTTRFLTAPGLRRLPR